VENRLAEQKHIHGIQCTGYRLFIYEMFRYKLDVICFVEVAIFDLFKTIDQIDAICAMLYVAKGIAQIGDKFKNPPPLQTFKIPSETFTPKKGNQKRKADQQDQPNQQPLRKQPARGAKKKKKKNDSDEEFIAETRFSEVVLNRKKNVITKWVDSESCEPELHVKLKHPNIIPVIGIIKRKNKVGINLPLCFKNYHRDTWFNVYENANELFKALVYLHSLNYAHLDVSPYNILFSTSGCLQLCDFGLSMHFSKAPYPYRGTEDFIAPEMYKNQGRSWYPDIWSAAKVISLWINLLLLSCQSTEEKENISSNLQKLLNQIQCCTNVKDEIRPTAIQVLKYLEGKPFI